MDNSTKQRLVGVMVLIALATIILPIVFHHSNNAETTLNIPQNAPPPPPMPDVQIAPPTQNTPATITPATITPVKKVSAIDAIEENTLPPETTLIKPIIAPITTVKPNPTPKLKPTTAHTKPIWLIQLGSFNDKANAEKMLANLTRHGFKAHTMRLKKDSKTITKVFIGPEYKRESADWIVHKLAKTLHTKGIIVKANA